MLNSKVLITGSGKSGTTFLVHLLTVLGLDTGYTPDNIPDNMSSDSYGGLEWRIRGKNAKQETPRIIKSPKFCQDLLERRDRWGWNIEHLYVSIRDFKAVGKHRFYRNKRLSVENTIIMNLKGAAKEKQKEFFNGLSEEQVLYLKSMKASSQIGYLIEQLTDSDIPYTLINFPKSVLDAEYCRNKLIYLVKSIPKEKFFKAYNEVADANKVRHM